MNGRERGDWNVGVLTRNSRGADDTTVEEASRNALGTVEQKGAKGGVRAWQVALRKTPRARVCRRRTRLVHSARQPATCHCQRAGRPRLGVDVVHFGPACQ